MLAAALSLAAVLAIDVPYLPQTDALCGGAAAAMVLRYWGEAHADAQEFAPLVDRRAGGIANSVLTAAVSTRGWRTERVDGTLAAIDARLYDRQPVIVLLPDRGDRYHYVVLTGSREAAIIVHDPAWGPCRTIRAGLRADVESGRLLVAGVTSAAPTAARRLALRQSAPCRAHPFERVSGTRRATPVDPRAR